MDLRSAAIEPEGHRQRWVLVVGGTSDLEEELLQSFPEDCMVLLARDLAEARVCLQENPPQWGMVMLSVTLSTGEDGVSLLREIYRDADMAMTPVLMLAQENERHREVETQDLGAVGFFVLPVDTQTLARTADALYRLAQKQNTLMQTRLYHQERALQRQRLVLSQRRTYVVEVDYATGELYIDEEMTREVGGNRLKIQDDYARSLEGMVYLSDMQKLKEVLDFSEMDSADEQRETNVRLRMVSGLYEWFHVTVCLQRDDQGRRRRMIISFANIHEDMLTRRQLELIASRDALTKIPNRETFVAETRAMLDNSPQQKFVMIRIDIEQFRIVTQLFGDAEGDRVLQFIAVKLQEGVESLNEGTYCRMTGDVFAACIPWEEESVSGMLERVQREATNYPINCQLLLAFGLYIIDEPDLPVSTMLDRATLAQKTVKGSVLRHEAYYDAALKKKDLEEQFILTQMNTALEEHQFMVYFQPKCRMDTGEVVGAEALARWRHPEMGMMPPGVFIPLFERNGFVSQLDAYIWEAVCKKLREWIEAGVAVKPVSVNISRMDLYNPRLKENILALVRKYNIPRYLLELELTESSFVTDEAKMRTLSEDLHREGFQILMDDFGSGYSSLNALKDLYIDQIKLDLRFLESTENQEKSGRILMSVVRMAKMLGMSVIAEGVETAEQAIFLQSLGCFVGQGYYFFRPLPTEEYETLLRDKGMVEAVGPQSLVSHVDYQAVLAANTDAAALFNLLADSVGLYELSEDGLELVCFNAGHAELVGVSREEGMRSARDTMRCIAPEHRQDVLEKLAKAEANGGVSVVEMQIKIRGGMLWVRAQIRFLQRQDGKGLFLITMTDTSREKELERQLEALRKKEA